MRKISRSRLLERNKCRHHYQVGDSYCPVGAFLAEYLGRDELGLFQGDGFFDAPEDVMNLMMRISVLSAKGLRKYTDISDSGSDFTKNWVDALGALLWDAEQEGMIELVD